MNYTQHSEKNRVHHVPQCSRCSMEQEQTARVFEIQPDIWIGDVFESVKYPNFTGIPKGSRAVVTSRTNYSADARVLDANGNTTNTVQIKIQWIVNGYLAHVGYDMSVVHTEYLRKMCSTMGINYLDIPVDKRDAWAKLPDKGAINLALLEYKASQKVAHSAYIQRALYSITDTLTARKKETLKSDLLHSQRQVRDAQEVLDSRIEDMVRRQKAIDDFSVASVEGAVESLSSVISQGWYKLYGVEGTNVVFTTPEIILTHQGTSLNFGQYKVKLNVENYTIRVEQYLNNIRYGIFVHPHVNDGSVCWGNASDARSKAQQSMDANKLLTLLREVLTKYNANSPFVSYETFLVQDKNNPRTSALNNPPEYHLWHRGFINSNYIGAPLEALEALPILTDHDGDGDTYVYADMYRKKIAGQVVGYYILVNDRYVMIDTSHYVVSDEEEERFREHPEYDEQMAKLDNPPEITEGEDEDNG